MENIEFKINASPRAILSIGLEKVKTNFIPSVIKRTFNGGDFGRGIADSSGESADFHRLYDPLLALTEEIKKEYENILLNYEKSGQIVYSQYYLGLVAKAKIQRKNLLTRFPGLPDYNSSTSALRKQGTNLVLDSAVGTGVNHLLQMEKIEKFVEENEQTLFRESGTKKMTALADAERIAIFDEKKNIFRNARAIEYRLNNSLSISEKRSLGRISVNPVFEEVRLIPVPKNKVLTVSANYPNGDTDIELGAFIEEMARSTESSEVDIKFKNADQWKVQDLIQNVAKKGYLRDVSYNNLSVIDINKSKFKHKE